MTMFWPRLAALAPALALAACVTTDTNKPDVQRGAFGVPLDGIQASGMRYVKGEDKIVIGAFRVAFNQTTKASSQRSSLFSTGSAAAHMSGKLMGLESRHYQAIADAAYADFVGKLRAAGFAVVEPPALAASPAYTRMAGVPSPRALDSSTTGDVLMVSPGGVKLVLLPGEEGVASAFGGFDANSPPRVFSDLVKEQNAGVAQITYYIDFLNASSSGKSMVAGGNAVVSMGQGLSVRAGSGMTYTTLRGSRCVGYCPDATTSVKLGQAVHAEEAYGSTQDVTNSAVNTIGVISGLLSGQSFSRKDLEIHADPDRYREIATKLLADANSALVGEIGKAR